MMRAEGCCNDLSRPWLSANFTFLRFCYSPTLSNYEVSFNLTLNGDIKVLIFSGGYFAAPPVLNALQILQVLLTSHQIFRSDESREVRLELSENEEVEERQSMCPKGKAGKKCRNNGVKLEKRQSKCPPGMKKKKKCPKLMQQRAELEKRQAMCPPKRFNRRCRKRMEVKLERWNMRSRFFSEKM